MRIHMLVTMLLLCWAWPAEAASFIAQVVRVKDGDSLVVWRPDVKRQSELRLAGIDAPELSQPWGIQSRSALRLLVDRRQVEVDVTDRDRYGRLVAKIRLGPIYVNARMTETGNAWAFRRYLDDAAIREGQRRARAAKRGLWSLPPEQQVPPATWRARNPPRQAEH